MTRSAKGRVAHPVGLRIRVILGDGVMIGPGKADLLEGIRETGSIAAAGRRLGMSYKRAWLLVETMNAGFAQPLVETSRGGARFGGASLTEAGAAVLGHYRLIEARAAEATAGEIDSLRRLTRDMANRK
jgi:molybdate transport system regulatory protein